MSAMQRTPNIHHLARALPEDERKELHKRITRSLSLATAHEKKVYHAEISPDQREELIRNDIEKLSFLSRFRLWLRRMLGAYSLHQAYIEMRVADLRHELRHSSLRIPEPEQSRIDRRVAGAVLTLYQQLQAGINLLRGYWSSIEHVHEMVSLLVNDTIPDSKRSLEELVGRRELEDIFLNTESKEELKKATVKALNEFVKNIHDSVFDEVKAQVIPLYYLRDLVYFDFGAFFKAFEPATSQRSSSGEPGAAEDNFVNAEMSAVIDKLEELYCAIHLASQAAPIGVEIARAHLRLVSPDAWEEAQAKEHTEIIRTMQRTVRTFRDNTPLVQLIRYYRGDPYHRLLLYTPKLRLRQFYESSLRMRVLGQLDDIFPEIRLRVVGTMVHTIFGPEPGDLYHYRGVAGGNIEKLGLPTFRYVRSLNIAYRMITSVYQNRYQNLLRLLLRIMPPGRRDVSEELHTNITGIEELQTRIEEFDLTLTPEADDGKLFHKLRQASETDRTQQRAYRVMVAQKDREARQMVVEARDHLHGLREQLENLASDSAEQLHERYRAFDPGAAKRSSLEAVLKERILELQNFTKLINQVLAVEEGA